MRLRPSYLSIAVIAAGMAACTDQGREPQGPQIGYPTTPAETAVAQPDSIDTARGAIDSVDQAYSPGSERGVQAVPPRKSTDTVTVDGGIYLGERPAPTSGTADGDAHGDEGASGSGGR